ncbi:twin transmembrane helix small protein [Sphingomonas cannabina]|uniref:twin transmembrane helix small protein n=1 Tax=Sphingomonas cannabina TaxID=2899123 RepID=UPI001F433BFB|nr:twin transmembrane helix small protein [Sphingomonas cannabina]UIJ46118.1 twin transmembrane helix small protein [Sphingomonas cannabina]
MSIFLVILMIAAMIAVLVVLVRGLVNFIKMTEEDLKGTGDAPSASALRSNKLMQWRIILQAVAILLAALVLFALGRG